MPFASYHLYNPKLRQRTVVLSILRLYFVVSGGPVVGVYITVPCWFEKEAVLV